MSDSVVCLDGVWVSYDGVPVLEDISLRVSRHDFLGIIGPNGGGKTTLLRILLGLIKPDRGIITLFGQSPEASRKRVGYVPQQAHFDRDFPISVLDVVMMGRMGHRGMLKKYGDEDYRVAEDVLRTVDMFDLRHRQIGKLSGGQRQRVFIARALATRPELLVLDEPSTGVDAKNHEALYGLLKKLHESIPIIMVSHDLGAVYACVDKVACLNRRLYYHDSKELQARDFENAYNCPVDLIAHGVPHRVLKEHREE